MTAQIIPFEKSKVDPVCSFCKTPKSKAKQMIASSDGTKFVCNACITNLKNILKENSQ